MQNSIERGSAMKQGDLAPTDDLRVEFRDDGVGVLTLSRPERLNALSPSMLDPRHSALERCAGDDAVGCVVVTGAGRGFCAGGDVTIMGDASATADWTIERKVDRQRAIHRLSGLLHATTKQTVAAGTGR